MCFTKIRNEDQRRNAMKKGTIRYCITEIERDDDGTTYNLVSEVYKTEKERNMRYKVLQDVGWIYSTGDYEEVTL